MSDAVRTREEKPTPGAAASRTTYVDFLFYRVLPEFRRLPEGERERGVQEFRRALEGVSGGEVRTYVTLGLRAEVDFLLWYIGPGLEGAVELASRILGTGLGRYLENRYAFVGLTKPTPYFKQERPQNFQVSPAVHRYLFFYPFAKTDAWYQLPLEDRRRMMAEHRAVGMRFERVKSNTVYNFGLGDYDFLLAFECDDPKDFNDLVQALRETKVRAYTRTDVPIIPCRLASPDELLDLLALR